MDRQFDVRIQPAFRRADYFSEGYAAVQVDEQRWGLIDTDGRVVLSIDATTLGSLSNGYARFVDRSGHGLIDIRGRRLLDGLVGASDFSEGLAAIKRGPEGWFYINTRGRPVFPGMYFESCGHFSDGVARVEARGLFGFIDRKGNYIIQPRYSYLYPRFEDGLAAAKLDGVSGYIDRTGTFVLQIPFYGATPFAEGVAIINQGMWPGEIVWKLIDKSGATLRTLDVYAANAFSEGYSVFTATTADGFRDGYLDTRGEIVIPAQFDEASSFRNGLALVLRGRRAGFVDKAGTVSWVEDILQRDR